MAGDNPYSTLSRNYNSLKNQKNYTSGGGLTTAQIEMAKAMKNAPTDTTSAPTTSASATGSKKATTTDNSSALASLYESLYGQKEALAQQAYENGLARVNDAYNSAASSYGNIYDRGASTLANALANSQNKINTQAKDSLREAYVNRMMNEKNLSQQLSALGITGGAAESSINKILNNYGTSRADINQNWNDNLTNLEDTYNNNLNNLYSTYQSQMAQLENQRASALNQLEANLANKQADVNESYLSLLSSNPKLLQAALASATSNMGSFTPTETAATNEVTNVNTQQKNDVGSVASQYAAYLQSLQNGANNSMQVAQNLINAGMSNKEILDLMNSGYFAK